LAESGRPIWTVTLTVIWEFAGLSGWWSPIRGGQPHVLHPDHRGARHRGPDPASSAAGLRPDPSTWRPEGSRGHRS